MRRVGRPSKIDKSQVIETLLIYKDTIINKENYKVRSKVDPIWNKISLDINHMMSPNALYTFVSCNKYGVRDILFERPQITSCDDEGNTCHDDDNDDDDNDGENIPVAERREDQNVTSNGNTSSEQMLDSTVSESIANLSNIGGISRFVITVPKEDFTSMIIFKKYQRTDKHRPKSTREYTVLKPGLWQHFFNEKIWQATKISCGFNFKRHKLTKSADSGYACGTCKCGSFIKLKINNSDGSLTKFECTYIEGQGKRCGKRYLRNPIRQDIAEKLKSTTAAKYRIEMAEKLMDESDKTEPPHLYRANVLKVAKHEVMQKSYLDKDVIKALHLMMLGPLKHVIHNLGLSPFFVYYWTNHQSHVYRTYALDDTACIYIDATGSIVRKIKNPDKTKTKHIFLYNCVANSEKSGLFPVCQMLSERHSTVAIHCWLMEWSKSGVPYPREIICDASRALLTAAVRNFTGFRTVEQYCNACKKNIMPSCYIRIDVAHFIKLYAKVLKGVRPRLRTFYLSLLGQLILCCNICAAEEILRAIFVIARSETEGVDRKNEKTICEVYKIKMKNLITSSSEEIFINEEISFTEEELANSDEIDIEQHLKTTIENNNDHEWYQWAKAIDNEVKRKIADNEGDRENAHYLPAFADRLMKNIQLIPMWSCICWDKFKYGRIPASSASVESNFNIIKNVLLKTEQTPMRADEFVMKHYNFITGRLKITNVNFAEKEKGKTTEDIEGARHRMEPMETCDVEASNRINSDRINNNLEDEINNDFISDIQSNNEDVQINDEDVQCPACKNGDMPSGAHKCCVCDTNVHALDACSVPIGEEGYGQKRLCKKCQKMQSINVQSTLASKEIEDWRGLASSKAQSRKGKGKYLQGLQSVDNEFLIEETIRKVPIIKNGGNISMKEVTFGKKKYSFTNTCAFDSILQLFVAAYFDKNGIKQFIDTESKNNIFFKLVADMTSCGVRQVSYKLRAQILMQIFSGSVQRGNCILIDCQVTVGFLCNKLFASYPTFREVSKCCNGCEERIKMLPLVNVDLNILLRKDFERLEQNIILQPHRCCHTNCDGLETTSISHPGYYLIFEIYADDEELLNVKLNEIPKTIKLSFMKEEHNLVGIIHYKSPHKSTRRSNDIGHYTAIGYRKNQKWIQYDDCKESEIKLNDNHTVCPHIIIYSI